MMKRCNVRLIQKFAFSLCHASESWHPALNNFSVCHLYAPYMRLAGMTEWILRKSHIKKLIATLFILLMNAIYTCAEAKPNLLHIQNWQTKNGLKVYFVASSTLPILDVQLLFDAGSSREGEKEGLAALTNTLLRAGGEQDSIDSIAEAFSSVGAELSVNANREMAAIKLRTLSAPAIRSKSLVFLGKMLKPVFKKEDLEREKAAILKRIQQKKDYPAKVAEDLFFKTLYGDHPYAHPVAGNADTIKYLSLEDVRTFFEHYYVAKNGSLVMVGAISLAEAKEISEQLSEAFLPGQKADPIHEAIVPQGIGAQQVMPTQQSHVIFGALGATRFMEEWPALYVGNDILGGGSFESRLFTGIREKEGLAYSVGSYFVPMQARGPWLANLETRYEKQDEALARVKKLVMDFVRHGPTDKEIQTAKQRILSGFPLRFRSNESIGSQVAMIAFYELPLDYYDQFLKRVAKVTAEEVHMAYKHHFSEENFVTIIVGPENAQGVKTDAKIASE